MELSVQQASVLFAGTPILVLTSVFDGVAIDRARKTTAGRWFATFYGLAAVYVLAISLVVILGGKVEGLLGVLAGLAAILVVGSVGGELISRIWFDDSEVRMRTREQARWSLQSVIPGEWELRYNGKKPVRAVNLTLKSDESTQFIDTRNNDIIRNDTFAIAGPNAVKGSQVTLIYVQGTSWKMWQEFLS